MSRSLVRATLAALALSASSSALAQQPTPTPTQPPAGEDAAARLLYESGAAALAAGEYATAYDRFQQAYDLSRRPGLLYNIGTALDRLRRDREALAAFEQFLREVPEHPRRAEVEARVGALRTAVAEEDARLLAEREAREARERELAAQAEEAQRRAEEQRRLAEEAAARAERAENAGIPKAITFSVGAVGVALGGVGMAFGLIARSRDDDYEAAARAALAPPTAGVSCDDIVCVTEDELAAVRAAHDDAESAQRIANIGLISGGAVIAATVVLAIKTNWGGDELEPTARVVVRPIAAASPTGAFAGVDVRF